MEKNRGESIRVVKKISSGRLLIQTNYSPSSGKTIGSSKVTGVDIEPKSIMSKKSDEHNGKQVGKLKRFPGRDKEWRNK